MLGPSGPKLALHGHKNQYASVIDLVVRRHSFSFSFFLWDYSPMGNYCPLSHPLLSTIFPPDTHTHTRARAPHGTLCLAPMLDGC